MTVIRMLEYWNTVPLFVCSTIRTMCCHWFSFLYVLKKLHFKTNQMLETTDEYICMTFESFRFCILHAVSFMNHGKGKKIEKMWINKLQCIQTCFKDVRFGWISYACILLIFTGVKKYLMEFCHPWNNEN